MIEEAMIYVLYCHSEPAFLKIGHTKTFKKRLSALQIGCPFKLTPMAIIPGTERDEKEIHEKLIFHRHTGEWFRCKKEVLDFFNINLDHWVKYYDYPEGDISEPVLATPPA